MSGDKATYVTYNEGLEAKHLHLGNLVHDYRNPNALDPYVEKSYTDPTEVPPSWSSQNTLSDFALTLGKTDSPNGARYQVVAAEKTIRIEIKEPAQFFYKNTLKTPTAKTWLQSHLSAADSLLKTHPPPQIYMLTGLILMTHATWSNISPPSSSSASKFKPGFPAPFKPLDASSLRRLSVSEAVKPVLGFRADNSKNKRGEDEEREEEEEEGKIVSGVKVLETGKYPGLRGWAARWQKVDVGVLSGGDEEDEKTVELLTSHKLLALELDEDGPVVVEDDEGDEGEDLEDAFWDRFLEKTDEYA